VNIDPPFALSLIRNLCADIKMWWWGKTPEKNLHQDTVCCGIRTRYLPNSNRRAKRLATALGPVYLKMFELMFEKQEQKELIINEGVEYFCCKRILKKFVVEVKT
jgi:DNA-directed RNA polymerase subunit N (RpoN/RPB10)